MKQKAEWMRATCYAVPQPRSFIFHSPSLWPESLLHSENPSCPSNVVFL